MSNLTELQNTRAELERAIIDQEHTYGANHPAVATLLVNLCYTL